MGGRDAVESLLVGDEGNGDVDIRSGENERVERESLAVACSMSTVLGSLAYSWRQADARR